MNEEIRITSAACKRLDLLIHNLHGYVLKKAEKKARLRGSEIIRITDDDVINTWKEIMRSENE
ncbi:MAG: hypothetical protein DWQ19_11385 [Crenarchaeota archaeon]|nr:MAG: hypothetical protein DWQ19_11385 [Thermoproteota archaeon]